MKTDRSGNVYVTGFSGARLGGYANILGGDCYTIKYNAAGTVQWAVRSDGLCDETPVALAVDSAGNVYVTGNWRRGLGMPTDIVTVKYSTTGTELWKTRYQNGTGASVSAIAADNGGNVFITGSKDDDYLTIKYNATGVQQWEARYNGPGNSTDLGYGLALDQSGNLYVTGLSRGSGGDYDCATIKYSPAGDALWVSRYNSPYNGHDAAWKIAVDDSGSVYITGQSQAPTTSYDMLTVKYNASGLEQYVARYNGLFNYEDGAVDIIVNSAGNAYVIGWSVGDDTTVDYVTVKYDVAGNVLWHAEYQYSTASWDDPYAIALDKSENVYVTGLSGDGSSTVKYNSKGETQWVTHTANSAALSLALDGEANVYTGGSRWDAQSAEDPADYATTKYSSSGQEQWTAPYDGPMISLDCVTDLAVDRAGNVYIAGISLSMSTVAYVAIKYSPLGVQQWIARNEQSFSIYYWIPDISLAVDTSGNVYLAGGFYVPEKEGFDYLTIKYNSLGTQEWVDRYASNSSATALAIDDSGLVYVTGDAVTIKYATSGERLWVTENTCGYLRTVSAQGITVDKAGNVYIAGQAGTGYTSDYVTMKYNASGVLQWIRYPDGPSGGSNCAWDLALDHSGNVYVTGIACRETGRVSRNDVVTIKYNPAGNEQWVARYMQAGSDVARIAVDDSGFANVTCDGIEADYATIKYSPDGVQLWDAPYNGAPYSDPYESYYGDQPAAIVLDAAGNIYVTGSSFGGPETGTDFATVKYNSLGNEQWVVRYHNSSDDAVDLALDPQGNVYVTGSSYSGASSIITTVKYSSVVESLEDPAVRPTSFALEQNYPNPFNPSTQIKYTVQGTGGEGRWGNVRLVVYDLLGREVALLVNERKPPGSYEVTFNASTLASGVYFYRLEADSFVQTKKLCLVK